MEFLASTESDRPPQTLVVVIEEQEYMWDPAESMEFILELDLKENVSVRIKSETPHSFGHAIDICLTATQQ